MLSHQKERERERGKLSQRQTKNAAKKTETETETYEHPKIKKTCKKNVAFFSLYNKQIQRAKARKNS